MKLRIIMTMKMKLNPEVSCLETQEKFWRGRLKEISDKFDAEKRNMQEMLFRITDENQQLRKKLQTLNEPTKCSVHVQTIWVPKETKTICEYCQRDMSKTLINVEEKNNNFHNNVLDKNQDNSSSSSNTSLIVNNCSSFATDENYGIKNDHQLERNENDVGKTITKLFQSNDQTDSSKIANKLIELYEKRNKLIPEISYDEEENLLITDNTIQNNSTPQIDIISNENEKSALVDPTEEPQRPERHTKINKIKFFPAVENVRKKMLKNFTRIKRSCVDIKAHNNKQKFCANDFNGDVDHNYIKNNIKSENNHVRNETENKISSEEISLPKCQLISAMKKSKSTGNIVKKVAFLDELPSTSKTISESNLFEVGNYKIKLISETSSLLVDAIHVHHDKYAKPIPAPRSKKNIIITKS